LTNAYANVLKAPLEVELRDPNHIYFSLRLPFSVSQPIKELLPAADESVNTTASQQTS
jgi:hypothetical protein